MLRHTVTGHRNHKVHEKSPRGLTPFIYTRSKQGLTRVLIQKSRGEGLNQTNLNFAAHVGPSALGLLGPPSPSCYAGSGS